MGRPRDIHVALAGLIALGALAVVAFVVFALPEDEAGTPPGQPREVSARELRSFARSLDHPAYWAGSGRGTDVKLELTHTAQGNVFVRYLPADVLIGNRRPLYTTVGSYPTADAYARALRAATARDATRRPAPGGGIAVWRSATPKTVYLAYPGSEVLVEVYAPTAARARSLALSGKVGPIR